MIVPYNKQDKKIAMGLLGFHSSVNEYKHLLKELDWYEQNEEFHLVFWGPDDAPQIQGLIGYQLNDETLTVHDISLNPSFRGEGYGYKMLDELHHDYPEYQLSSTLATDGFIQKWQDHHVS